MTNYIGIDTGTKLLGWAALNENGGYITSGWADLESTQSRKLRGWDSLEIRFKNLSNWAIEFFGDYGPVMSLKDAIGDTIVGIEHPWIGRNKQTALTLGMAWGIIAQAAMRCGFPIVKIEPAQAKKALTGSGLARKSTMLELARISGAKCEGKGKEDEADALGVALATRFLAIERRWSAL